MKIAKLKKRVNMRLRLKSVETIGWWCRNRDQLPAYRLCLTWGHCNKVWHWNAYAKAESKVFSPYTKREHAFENSLSIKPFALLNRVKAPKRI